MVLTPQQAILRAIPLPLAVSILSGLVTFITPYAQSSVLVASVVGILLYIEKVITTFENNPASVAVVAPVPLPVVPTTKTITPSKLTLTITPSTAAIGANVTYSVTGAAANSTFKLYDESDTQVTGTYPTDANGNGSFTAQLTTQGVIGDELSQDGSVTLYAVDGAGADSQDVTITQLKS